MRVATDVGGTFTDYVISKPGKLTAFKTLTTTDASTGILDKLQKMQITEFSHGTTAAVNAILQRNGGPVVFFTTHGFKDLVHIGRQARNNVYSFTAEKPVVPIDFIEEIPERTGTDGTIIEKLSTQEMERAARKYSGKVKAAVVGFLNSYVNPANELAAEAILKPLFPIVVSSHKIRREIREYERFTTGIMEAYCLPAVKDYMKNMVSLSDQFYVMQSNGGRTERKHLRAVNMIMSGPAGGVAAAQALCKNLGIQNAIAYDMGGTSADVSAIVDGEPLFTDTVRITGLPIRTMAIDIESIGAGGGSIAWVDDGGALKVGPKSAGANPGPACYDAGGTNFTVSDANLLTGVLGETISNIKLNQQLHIDHNELSTGVLRIVNNNMVSALKRISVGRGYDPREFALVAFGGAGPMHACAIAELIGISKVIIPPMAGAFSAFGILTSPVRFDFIRTLLLPLENASESIQDILVEFKSELKDRLKNRFEEAVIHVSMDLRYLGQGHDINIPSCDNIAKAFHQRHEALFGFTLPENTIELVNVKLVAELPPTELSLHKYPENPAKIRTTRSVLDNKEVSVYARDFFGTAISAPSIIEDDTTTIYIAPDWSARLDQNDVLIMERD
jgi:N-methylhydantoinase A